MFRRISNKVRVLASHALAAVATTLVVVTNTGAARTEFNPGKFMGCPDTSVLDPISGGSVQVTGWIMGIGVIVLFVVLVIGGLKIGAARDDLGKAHGGAMTIRHAAIGLGFVLIAIPLALIIIPKLVFCH